MATDGTKLNQLPELTTLSDATMLYAVDGGEDYHVNFETIKDETVPEVFTPTTNGLVPHPNSGNGGKVLRGDGTWQGTFDSSNDGLVPKLGTNDKDNVLRGDGTWVANDKLIGTGSGSLVTFDAIEAPMPSLKVSVEANQDLHGYDKPWVGGAGKNKLSTNYVVSRLTSNNVDIVRNDDGSLDVTIDGTCSGTVNYLFKQTDVGSGLKAGSYKAILIADGTYTGNIQLTIGGGTSEVSYRIAPLNTTTETFTISNDDATLHYCLLQFATGATVTGKLKIYPMICSSSEDMTTWAPYSNICPISGWGEANVSDHGQNLFESATFTQGTISGSGAPQDSNTRIRTSSFILVPSGTYKIKSSPELYGTIRVYSSNSYTSYVSGESLTSWTLLNGYEFTLTSDRYMIIVLSKSGTEQIDIVPSDVDKIVVSSAIDTTIISLPQTVYGGELDVVNGILKLTHKSITFDGITNPFIITNDRVLIVDNAITDGVSSEVVCNQREFGAIIAGARSAVNYPNKLCVQALNGIRLALYDANYTTAEDFNTFLASNPMQVLYELAEPIIINLTPSLIKSLNGINNLSVDCGEVLEGRYYKQSDNQIRLNDSVYGRSPEAIHAIYADIAENAEKAIQDESGNNIKASYASSFSIDDHTITLKNKNNISLGTVTVPNDFVAPVESITTPTSLATFNASAMPMPSLKVSVEAKQDLHGYDHPWVGGAGKNKLDSTTFTRTNKSGQSNVNWARWDEFIPCIQSSYTLSCGFNVTLYALNVDLYDENQSLIEALDLGQFSSNGKTFSVENQSAKYMKISIYNNSSMENYDFSHAQLELGSTATSFEPYSNICPISGWDEANVSDVDDVDNPTVTQTTTISLPQTVYGGELDVVNGILKITDGYIASYNGETLPSTWISSMDEYAEGTSPTTGAEVCYELANPIIINLTPTLIKTLNGQNNISVDSGDIIELEYFKEV